MTEKPVKTRRGNGEGSKPFQRADGRWMGFVRVGTKVVDGKRIKIRKTIYGETRKECAANIKTEIRALDNGTIVTGKINTLEEWMNHWIDKIAARKVRPSTLDAYRSLVRRWINPHLGNVRLNKLTPEHLDELYDEMRVGGRSDATILKAHRVLSRALTVAVQRDRLGTNPCLKMDAPSYERKEMKSLTAADAKAILKAANLMPGNEAFASPKGGRPRKSIPNAARWTVALAMGLRQGESLGLCWDMVDLDAGTLQVARGWLRAADGQPARIGPLKTKGSRRTLHMPETLVQQLRKHRREQMRVRMQEGPNWVGYVQEGVSYDLVFSGRDGRPTGHAADTKRWKELLAVAKVPDARLHDARHTAATLLMGQGVPARVVMGLLGHSSISMTMDTYSHVLPELSVDASLKMDDLLTGGGNS